MVGPTTHPVPGPSSTSGSLRARWLHERPDEPEKREENAEEEHPSVAVPECPDAEEDQAGPTTRRGADRRAHPQIGEVTAEAYKRSHGPMRRGARCHASHAKRCEVAPGSHAHAKRDKTRLPATRRNALKYTEYRTDRPPPHVHGKEGVDGSSPSEGLKKSLQIGDFSGVLVAHFGDTRSHRGRTGGRGRSVRV
jgi:hypothetical protein